MAETTRDVVCDCRPATLCRYHQNEAAGVCACGHHAHSHAMCEGAPRRYCRGCDCRAFTPAPSPSPAAPRPGVGEAVTVADPQQPGGSIEFGAADAKGGRYWRVVRSSVGRKCDRAHLALLDALAAAEARAAQAERELDEARRDTGEAFKAYCRERTQRNALAAVLLGAHRALVAGETARLVSLIQEGAALAAEAPAATAGEVDRG